MKALKLVLNVWLFHTRLPLQYFNTFWQFLDFSSLSYLCIDVISFIINKFYYRLENFLFSLFDLTFPFQKHRTRSRRNVSKMKMNFSRKLEIFLHFNILLMLITLWDNVCTYFKSFGSVEEVKVFSIFQGKKFILVQ